jgi:hypothetical protein
MSDVVKVGIANDGEQVIKVEIVEKWEPTNINYIGDAVFFKADETYFSMKTIDFKKIFNK